MKRPHNWRRDEVISHGKLQSMTDAIRELQNKLPVIPRKSRRGGSSAVCPLGTIRKSEGGGNSYYIAEGFINSAGNHVAVGGEGTTFSAQNGLLIWAEATITATVEEGAMTGDWTSTAEQLGSGTTAPTDHAFTADAPTGKAYAVLGTFTEDDPGSFSWAHTGCGDVTFLFCSENTYNGTARFYRG